MPLKYSISWVHQLIAATHLNKKKSDTGWNRTVDLPTICQCLTTEPSRWLAIWCYNQSLSLLIPKSISQIRLFLGMANGTITIDWLILRLQIFPFARILQKQYLTVSSTHRWGNVYFCVIWTYVLITENLMLLSELCSSKWTVKFGRPLHFFFQRNLADTKRKRFAFDRKVLAIFLAVKNFRHFVKGRVECWLFSSTKNHLPKAIFFKPSSLLTFGSRHFIVLL